MTRNHYAYQPSYRETSRDRSKHTAGAIMLVVAAALAVFGIGCALSLADAVAGTVTKVAFPTSSVSDAEPAHHASTPASQWKRGSVPYLYQQDPAWADASYAGETIRTAGCGPTCLAMVYVALTGATDMDPQTACAFSERNGFVEDGMTRWALLDQGAAQLGLHSRLINVSANAMKSELSAGHPLIVSMEPGDFTSVGHFIVVAGVDASGKLVIRDPNSAERSHTAWDVARIASQARAVWAFEAV